jgi:hypothetical protein
MTIDEIRQTASRAPTMMELGEELRLFSLLMKLSPESIRDQWPAFSEILDTLSVSHAQAFFDVDASSRPCCLRFADWLDGLVEQIEDPGKQAALRSAANHFRAEPSTFTTPGFAPRRATNPMSLYRARTLK